MKDSPFNKRIRSFFRNLLNRLSIYDDQFPAMIDLMIVGKKGDVLFSGMVERYPYSINECIADFNKLLYPPGINKYNENMIADSYLISFNIINRYNYRKDIIKQYYLKINKRYSAILRKPVLQLYSFDREYILNEWWDNNHADRILRSRVNPNLTSFEDIYNRAVEVRNANIEKDDDKLDQLSKKKLKPAREGKSFEKKHETKSVNKHRDTKAKSQQNIDKNQTIGQETDEMSQVTKKAYEDKKYYDNEARQNQNRIKYTKGRSPRKTHKYILLLIILLLTILLSKIDSIEYLRYLQSDDKLILNYAIVIINLVMLISVIVFGVIGIIQHSRSSTSRRKGEQRRGKRKKDLKLKKRKKVKRK